VAGEPARTILSFDQAGGSGAHATGVVHQLGGNACSLVLLGGYNGERWRTAAEARGMRYDYIDVSGVNRCNFVLIDTHAGNIAEIIDPGPPVDIGVTVRLLQLIERYIEDTGILILSGSLPPGIPEDFYVQAIELAKRYGVKTLVDSSSIPLHRAIGARPWALKPNLFEFQQMIGVETHHIDEHIQYLRGLVGTVAEVLLLSLGKDGLLVANSENIWHLTAPAHQHSLPNSSAVNTVGCGDAMVGGFSHHYVKSGDILQSACWGIAAATVNLGTYEVPSCPPEAVSALVPRIRITLMKVTI
jgi:1-phosphofructokinase family hexose kinase